MYQTYHIFAVYFEQLRKYQSYQSYEYLRTRNREKARNAGMIICLCQRLPDS
ncbi:hypothetical protein [Nodularia harveyana]|uniref:hypothetical protein n=1 Tax=Nodularia harveyana TaxID=114805 RepID=UPI002B215B30|nr:hypothetical protein [Nodularia harveyana]